MNQTLEMEAEQRTLELSTEAGDELGGDQGDVGLDINNLLPFPLQAPGLRQATPPPSSEFRHSFTIPPSMVPWEAISSLGWHICCSSEYP